MSFILLSTHSNPEPLFLAVVNYLLLIGPLFMHIQLFCLLLHLGLLILYRVIHHQLFLCNVLLSQNAIYNYLGLTSKTVVAFRPRLRIRF